jgi:hypothetical protein
MQNIDSSSVKQELSDSLFPQIILVPQGAEYKAVCRGIRRLKSSKPRVVPIPMGSTALVSYLEQWQQNKDDFQALSPQVLVMGLCGSLSPDLTVGDIVLYQTCIRGNRHSSDESNQTTPLLQSCDRHLTTLVHHKLKERVLLVQALTSDRIITSAAEKRQLAQLYNAHVVDMEGFAALETLSQAGIAVAMVRVISDDSHHNLPNLASALNPDGSLQPVPLAMGMIRQPIAATRFIRGALHGLSVLKNVTIQLFSQ